MTQTHQTDYLRGSVESFDKSAGYGYIRPDDDQEARGELLLVHKKSLRAGITTLHVGDRVLFKLKTIPRGTLATDVHPELSTPVEPFELPETVSGEVVIWNAAERFGFIRIPKQGNAFFHISFLTDPAVLPAVGDRVMCRPVMAERGLQAQDVVIQAFHSGRMPRAVNDLLAQAVLAREERRPEDADKLYRRGMRECPSEHFISSYAAFAKSRNRKLPLEIYEYGIKLFPDSTKLLEEAGVHCASVGLYPKAVAYLEAALRRCRGADGVGEKGILVSLALTYYRIGSIDALRQSVKCYEEAVRVYGGIEKFKELGRNGGPLQNHWLAMNLAEVRLHQIGNIVFNFFSKRAFKILQAELLPISTVGADLVVKTDNVELIESYGLTGQLLVRCIFKSNVTVSDLEALGEKIASLPDGVADDQVALVAVGSISESVQRFLFGRIEDRNELKAAIVPLTEQDIETSQEPVTTLLAVLDKWLYRRDLYALNSPVKGRRFFGRGKALAEIRDAVHTSTPIGIFGLRKVGKTSLLQEAAHRSTESGDIVLYVDLLRVPSEISDARWLYWRLGNLLRDHCRQLPLHEFRWRLGGVYKDYLDIPADLPVATAFDSDLTRLLQEIEKSSLKPRPKVVLLLDEVESLLPTRLGRGFKGFFDFFSYLRGVCQETKQFTLVITAANPSIAEIPQFDGRDNPVFNFFREVYLQLLEPSECAEMIKVLGKGMGIRYENESVCNHIFYLTGGHPFFTRQLCSFIAKKYQDRPLHVTKGMVDDVVERYIDLVGEKDFNEIFQRLSRDYPEERDACVLLAKSGGSLTMDQLSKNLKKSRLSLRHLEGYQVITIRDQQVSLSMELLKRWLQRGYVEAS